MIDLVVDLGIIDREQSRRRTVGQNVTKVRQKSFPQILNFDIFLQVYES